MDRNLKLEKYLIIGLFAWAFFSLTLGLIAPILLGFFLAMVFHPIHKLLRKTLAGRETISAGLLTVGLTIGVIVPLVYMGAVIGKDLMNFANSLKDLPTLVDGESLTPDNSSINLDFLLRFKERIYSKIEKIVAIPRSELDTQLNWVASTLGTELAKFLGFIAKSAPKLGLEIVFFILALFYGLLDGSKLGLYLKQTLPFNENEYQAFKQTSQQVTRGVILGSLLSGLTQGLLIGLGFWIFDIPRPFFFGLMTLIFSFIPFVGSAPAGIGGTIYLYANEHSGAALGMLIFFLVATFSDNVIKPLALKGKSELHALVALISVLGGLGLFGFSGLFLGPLSAALAIEGFRILGKSKTPN